MGLLDGLRNRLVGIMQGIMNDAYTSRANDILDRRQYRLGMQKRQLKVTKFDDNIVMNYTGLAVDRGVSMLFGNPPEFEYEKGEGATEEEVIDSPQEEYIDETWKANNKAILLHKLALFGAEAGHCYVKIVPLGVTKDGQQFHRLIALDPAFMDMTADPDDQEKILKFTIQYKIYDANGKEVVKREITQWTPTSETDPTIGYWLITTEINRNGRTWEPVGNPINWEWDFPPIVQWQNLPNTADIYGMPDVTDDVVELQDRINFVASNMSKIIRLYAHPQRWSKFFSNRNNTNQLSLGPDDMPNSDNPAAEINQMSPVADLETSRLFGLNLRQSLFDITRTVDITSLADKIGALTNFGLHVLYQDAMSKLDTKQELYGAGLKEINRRLLALENMEPLECEVVWESPLPENIVEEAQVDQIQLGLGIVSKQTISEHAGYDWQKEQARMKEDNAGTADLGTQLLNAFNKGQGNGVPTPMTQPVAKMPPIAPPMIPGENQPNA